jgi:hypothetical protein
MNHTAGGSRCFDKIGSGRRRCPTTGTGLSHHKKGSRTRRKSMPDYVPPEQNPD